MTALDPNVVIPDVVGPVTVWRYWMIVDRVLRSPLRHTPWLPDRRLGATCNTYGHPAPDPGCLCGIHGLNTAEAIANYAGGPSPEFVFGQVELSGRAIQGEHGWRATQAQIVSLVDGPGVGQLAEHYGVPVIPPPWGLTKVLYNLGGNLDYPPNSASPAAIRDGHDKAIRPAAIRDGHDKATRHRRRRSGDSLIAVLRASSGKVVVDDVDDPPTLDTWYEVITYRIRHMTATLDPRMGSWIWEVWSAHTSPGDEPLWVTGPAQWFPYSEPPEFARAPLTRTPPRRLGA